MANFTTHIAVGTVASGLLATVAMAADVVSPENLLTVALAGTLGSVLPDIDLKDSRPGQAIFSGLAVFLAFVVLFNVGWRYSIAEMWIIWIAVFLGVRYGAHYVFHRMSYHRGIYHSILAGVFFAFVTAIVFKHLFNKPSGVAWLAGAFMFIGYLVHLTLDEIYSVDVMDTRIKASFGTALKLWDGRRLDHSAMMAVAVVAVFFATPPSNVFVQEITSKQLWTDLRGRLLPKEKWFGVVDGRDLAKAPPVAPADTGAITTGSIPNRAPEPPKPETPAAPPAPR